MCSKTGHRASLVASDAEVRQGMSHSLTMLGPIGEFVWPAGPSSIGVLHTHPDTPNTHTRTMSNGPKAISPACRTQWRVGFVTRNAKTRKITRPSRVLWIVYILQNIKILHNVKEQPHMHDTIKRSADVGDNMFSVIDVMNSIHVVNPNNC